MAPFTLLVSLVSVTTSKTVQTSPHSLQPQDSGFTSSALRAQHAGTYTSWLPHRICRTDENSGAPSNSWAGRLCGWAAHAGEDQTTHEEWVPQDQNEQPAGDSDLELSVSETDIVIEVEPQESILPNCETIDDLLDEYGNPSLICDYVDGDYDEWVQSLNKPFASEKGCLLTPECHRSHYLEAHPRCACYCDDEQVPLLDDRCAGFAGKVPEYFIPITIPK